MRTVSVSKAIFLYKVMTGPIDLNLAEELAVGNC